MGLFRKAPPPRPRFPADMVGWLEEFGQHRLDTLHNRIDGDHIWSRLGPLIEDANRDGFLADLAALVANDRAGLATLGAAGVVWEIYGGEALDIPEAFPLIDAGIAVKQARGLPTATFTGYERQRYNRLRQPS